MPHPISRMSPSRRFLFGLFATLTLAALGGSGCNGFKAGESAPPNWAVQKFIDNWPTTHADMLAMLRAGVEVQSAANPERVVVAQIALKREIPAREVITWFKSFPSSSFVTWYTRAGEVGGGFYNFNPEMPAKDELLSELAAAHQQEIQVSKDSFEEMKRLCAEGNQMCRPGALEREQKDYALELERPSLVVVGLALRGPVRDLARIQNDSRVYSVQIEAGSQPQGIPFYQSIQEVSRWRP